MSYGILFLRFVLGLTLQPAGEDEGGRRKAA